MRMAHFHEFGGHAVANHTGRENCDFHNASFLLWWLIVLGNLPGSFDTNASRKQKFLPARPGLHP